MSFEAIALASSCELPEPVTDSCSKHISSHTDAMSRPQHMKVKNTNVQIAPYQALPVAGPVITHHRSTAFKVSEPTAELPEEVGSIDVCTTNLFAHVRKVS